MQRNYKIWNILFILLVSFLLTSCGIGEAIKDIFSDDDSPLQTLQEQSIGQTINYRVFAANNAQVNVEDVTDAQIVTYFSLLFKTQSDSIAAQAGLQCDSAIIYYVNVDGDKTFYETNQTVITYNENYPGMELTVNGDYLYIKTYNMPSHQSEYFLNSSNPKFCGDGYADGLAISSYYSTFVLPLSNEVTYLTELNDNAIGIALNGVLLFSNEVIDNNGTETILTFDSQKDYLDSYMGRSSETNGYYYLAEPGYFTGYDYKKETINNLDFEIETYSANNYTPSRNALIGFAKDGFPIYGPYEYNTEEKPTNLDECRGHVSDTGAGSVFSFGVVYHYHVEAFEDIESAQKPIIGCYSGVSP